MTAVAASPDLATISRMNPSRARLEEFIREAAAATASGARVLDAGAGDGRHRALFWHADYHAADFEAVETKHYAANDIVCDLAEIPVEDDTFDVVLLTQVLEHIPEPAVVLAELARVLKPGGTIYASMPLFYEEHEAPYDFYRYTQFGLRHLFAGAGFDVQRVDWLEGYFGTLSYQLKMAATQLPTDRAVYGSRRGEIGARVCRSVAWRLMRVCDRLERRHKLIGVGMPKNYALVARKP